MTRSAVEISTDLWVMSLSCPTLWKKHMISYMIWISYLISYMVTDGIYDIRYIWVYTFWPMISQYNAHDIMKMAWCTPRMISDAYVIIPHEIWCCSIWVILSIRKNIKSCIIILNIFLLFWWGFRDFFCMSFYEGTIEIQVSAQFGLWYLSQDGDFPCWQPFWAF